MTFRPSSHSTWCSRDPHSRDPVLGVPLTRCACPPQAEAIAPQLLETLQDPGGTGAGPTRLRLLDALAKVAGLGVGTAYREVVVLLVRLYLNHVQVRPPGGLNLN
jgi:hypothetical protein